jgi:RNA polymerase sigma-B factor
MPSEAMFDPRTTRRSASSRRSDDHSRAEALLAEAHPCRDARRRTRLRQEAVLLCLDLADAAAHRYRERGIPLEDLVQVARMALVKAAGRYRPGMGQSFGAYAEPTIAGEVKRHFRDAGWMVRPPRRLQEMGAAQVAEENRLQQTLGRPPSRSELADALGVSTDEVSEVQRSQTGFRLPSLDAPTTTQMPLSDTVPDGHDPVADLEWRDALHHAVSGLDERDQRIVHLRFVEERTQAEIGDELGVTQMQISRLLASITTRLRADIEEADAAVDRVS